MDSVRHMGDDCERGNGKGNIKNVVFSWVHRVALISVITRQLTKTCRLSHNILFLKDVSDTTVNGYLEKTFLLCRK